MPIEGDEYVRTPTLNLTHSKSTAVLDIVIQLSIRIRSSIIIQTGTEEQNIDSNAVNDENSRRTSTAQ